MHLINLLSIPPLPFFTAAQVTLTQQYIIYTQSAELTSPLTRLRRLPIKSQTMDQLGTYLLSNIVNQSNVALTHSRSIVRQSTRPLGGMIAQQKEATLVCSFV